MRVRLKSDMTQTFTYVSPGAEQQLDAHTAGAAARVHKTRKLKKSRVRRLTRLCAKVEDSRHPKVAAHECI